MQPVSHQQRGITITEILVVLVLFVILALLITPAYTTYYAQNRLKSAAERLYSEILLARTNAIKTQSNAVLTMTSGSSWCFGFTTSASCDCNTASNCNLGQTQSAEFQDTTLSLSGGFSGGTVTFDGVRGIPNTTGSAVFTSATGESIEVSLNLLGTPKVCSSTVGGYAAC